MLIEAYLCGCSEHLEQLKHQVSLMNELTNLSEKIKTSPSDKRDSILKTTLETVQFSMPICLPYDPRIRVDGIYVDKCKWIDSNSVILNSKMSFFNLKNSLTSNFF